jgi:hypothetical protein
MAPKKELAPAPEEDETDDIEMEEMGEEEDMDYDEEEEMGFDLGAALEPFLATEDGQTVATALVTIAKHMEMQNKILVKMLSKLSKE